MNDYPIKTPKQLGSVLQGYRRERGLTQTDVGAKVGLRIVEDVCSKNPEWNGAPGTLQRR